MQANLINYLLAFIEGFALIASPCILPILPIMLSASIEGGKKRPLGIVCGFVIVFALFTFFSRTVVTHTGINLDIIRNIAFGLIILFGIILISDYLSQKFNALTQWLGNLGSRLSSQISEKPQGFGSGLLLGALVSLIWVPCAGPILAAAIVQTATQKSTLQSFLTFLFFGLGSAVPMLLIALFGRTILNRSNFLKTHAELLRKIFGVIIIITAGLAAYLGSPGANLPMPAAPNVTQTSSLNTGKLIHGLAFPYAAPALKDNAAWINSEPLTLADLKGKVVLIDFWTYSCINCVRTLPYLKSWYAQYHDRGLVIIGVHTPEFEFEKNLNNVQQAVVKYGIKYPVALDNQYATWLKYHNHSWPADYLIDKKGNVVYAMAGEGDYDVTENNIRTLLGISGPEIKTPANPTVTAAQTPETYLGYARAENFSSPESISKDSTRDYSFPKTLPINAWALQGKWNIQAEKITSQSQNSAIKIHFYAGKVFVVMGSHDNKPLNIKVFLNDQPIDTYSGKDVTNNVLKVSKYALYEVVNLPQPNTGTLELQINAANAELYTFTFGN